MRLKGIIISLIVIAAIVVICASVQSTYDGKAKIVLKLVQIPPTPTPIPAHSTTSSFAEDATTFGFPVVDVPHGTVLQATVLYSEDPALKVGDTCSLLIDYDNSNVPSAMQTGLLDKLLPGSIVGVNEYTLSGGQVKVNLENTAAWGQKIFIVDMSQATPGENSNPFRIDLDMFKDFSSTFPSNDMMSTPTPSFQPAPSTLPVPGFSGGFDSLMGHFFGW
jgi:hypothetical protein